MKLSVIEKPTAFAGRRRADWSVTLRVDNGPTKFHGVQPVSIGVPFPVGRLTDPDRLWLAAGNGQETPLQHQVLARWADGSVKWLLLDFVITDLPAGESAFQLCHLGAEAAPRKPSATPSFLVEDWSDEIVIRNGAVVFRIDRKRFSASLERAIAEPAEGECARLSAMFADRHGRPRQVVLQRSAVESQGQVRTTLLLEGTLRRSRGLRFRCRLCFFAGTGLVRMRVTLHNPNRARHPGGLWDLGDPGSILFRDFSLTLETSAQFRRFACRAEPGGDSLMATDGRFEIYQDSSGGENWQSRNHVNREGRVPCRFQGYQLSCSQEKRTGRRATPTTMLHGDELNLVVTLPEFWQQFPKLIAAEPNRLRVGLFPNTWSDLHELQAGEQKTHTVWLCWGNATEATLDSLAWVHEPARLAPAPEWTEATGALPHFVAAAHDPDDRLQALLSEVLSGPQALAARRETIDEYGWRNYGEIYADHENAYFTGHMPAVSHYNNQYDMVYGMLVQWLRTPNRQWFQLADALARHVIDIDVYHTLRDRAAYSGGMFWHTDHYRDAGTATHRSYSRANIPAPGVDYGGGPANEHIYTTGLLHYYYLTGDPQALDTVVELANWVVRLDEGRLNILGLIDDGPTGLATVGDDYGNSVPGRGPANTLNALLDAWMATGKRTYLDLAEVFIRRVIHPADDIERQDLLNLENRWPYTMFLAALGRYLALKREAGEQDRMYAYGRQSLLRYAEWMQQYERPYFDREHEMEFPTETWAAQEMRKANVMRLAAQYATGPLRVGLVRRANELAERAWLDLSRFATRFATRPVAILLIEGVKDNWFRGNSSVSAAEGVRQSDYGLPQHFVPQKRRAFEQLKTTSGLARAFSKALLPTTYLRMAALCYRRCAR